MNYDIIRSSRKSIAVTVDKSGRVIVRAPFGVSKERIDEFVESKADKIGAFSDEAAKRAADRIRRLSLPPESLPFLGELCPVRSDPPYGYSDGCFHLPQGTPLEQLLPYLRKLYSSIAKDTLTARTYLLADRMGIKPAAVKINSARTRWGSCSVQGVINLSWKLIAADSRLIDYVIVHELCHTEQLNHSPAFWEKVAAVIPDYHERREALKDVQRRLAEYGLD